MNPPLLIMYPLTVTLAGLEPATSPPRRTRTLCPHLSYSVVTIFITVCGRRRTNSSTRQQTKVKLHCAIDLHMALLSRRSISTCRGCRRELGLMSYEFTRPRTWVAINLSSAVRTSAATLCCHNEVGDRGGRPSSACSSRLRTMSEVPICVGQKPMRGESA